MADKYTGFKTLDVLHQLIEDIHCDGKIPIFDKRYAFHPNLYLELRSETNPKSTALAKVSGDNKWIEKITVNDVNGIKPRNREQAFALHALMDSNIKAVTLTGSAGTGKTLLALAVAMQQIQDTTVSKVILTRPMSYVGKYSLGALPGSSEEKFQPYLLNYTTNLEQMVGKKQVNDVMDQLKFEMVPLQLIRGASFNNCLVLADEVQVCDFMEILTIGTRIGDNSKIILMGDLNQRDEKITKEKTGIYKFFNDQKSKDSPLVACIELQRCERSEIARVFASVFDS